MAKEPKFQFKEKVIISSGFLRTQKGTVLIVHKRWFGENRYTVRIGADSEFGSSFQENILESQLQSLDFPTKEFNNKLQKVIKE